MKCTTCGAVELVRDTRDLPYTYKGESTIIPDVTGDFCSACDEVITNADESRRTMALMMEFNKQVKARLLTPALSPESVKSWHSTNGKRRRFSAAVSMRFPATRMARPSRHWRW